MEFPGELSCTELVELVTEYLEEALTPTLHVRFETHLDACRGCHVFLDQMRQTIRILGELCDESIAPETELGLLQVFRAWKADHDGSPTQDI